MISMGRSGGVFPRRSISPSTQGCASFSMCIIMPAERCLPMDSLRSTKSARRSCRWRPSLIFCGALAARCDAWPTLVLGLMNEPFGITPKAWLGIANGAIARIRSVGSQHLILVPGIAYTGAHSWHTSGNDVMGGIIDPRDNFAIEVHQYLDADASGTRPDVVSATIGPERIEAFQKWARRSGLRAYLGEFAAGSDAFGRRALINLVAELERNSDVWIGWAAWAAGSWWPSDYIFRIDGTGVSNLYTQTLSELARGTANCETSR